MPKRLIVLSPATYTLTQEDGTDTTSEVAAKVAGSIAQSSPTIGDTLTVTGDNTSALAGFRAAEVDYIWEESADGSTGWSAISGATSASLDTSSGVTGDYYVRRGWRGPNDTAYARTAAVQVAGAAFEFTDTFDQPNGTDLSTLSDYTRIDGGAGEATTNGLGEWVIPSGGGNDNQYLLYTGTLANDQFAEVVVGSNNGENFWTRIFLFLRATDASNAYEIERNALSWIKLWKIVGGTRTELIEASGTINSGDRIRAEVQGDQITVLVNGNVFLGPVTDTSLTSGSAGFGLISFNRAVTDISLSEFKCGDL